MVKHILSGFLVLAAAAVVACSSSEPTPHQTDSDQEAQRAFWAEPKNLARLKRYVNANVHFTMLHEAAHYLFRVLDVPVAGREEDAADRFAVALMLPGNPGPGGNTEVPSSAEASDLVWVAYSWLSSGRSSIAQERARIPWYDEHGADEQRGYDILCLLYGSNPKRFELTVQDSQIGIPSSDRLAKCPAESARNTRAFQQLFGAFVMTEEEVARRIEQDKPAPQPIRSGSAAEDILKGGTSSGTTMLTSMGGNGIFYHDYDSPEIFWNVPWFPWDSRAFLREHDSLERVRNILLSLRLPDGTVIPTITGQSCGGEANAFYGIDPSLFSTKERAQQWTPLLEKGLLRPEISLCYPLVDGFSWEGRALIWRSEQEKARRQ